MQALRVGRLGKRPTGIHNGSVGCKAADNCGSDGKTSDPDFQAVTDVVSLRIQLVIVRPTFTPSMSLRPAWSLERT